MRIFNLIWKDLMQVLHDKKSLIFLLAMPLAFTFFMGMMFKSDTTDPRLRVGIVNNDAEGLLSESLDAYLNASNAITPVKLEGVTLEQAQSDVKSDLYSSVLIIPDGFSAELLAGGDVRPTLVVDPTTSVGQLALNAVQNVGIRWLGSAEAAILSFDALPPLMIGDKVDFIHFGISKAQEFWQSPLVTLTVEPVVIGSKSATVSGFEQASPGMIVQFAIFGLTTTAIVLVTERKNHCLQRMLTTPVSKAEVIIGHGLALFLIIFLQELILVVGGQLIFKVNYFYTPLATLLIMLALAFWVASMGMFVGAVAKKEEQVIVWSLVAMFLFSSLGGAWFPLEGVSDTFRAVGHISPAAWAMDGFQNVVIRHLGLSSALLPALMLLGYGLLFLVLAIWRLRAD